MSFVIHIGWWLIPVAATMLMTGWVVIASATDRPTGGDYNFNLYPLFRVVIALPVCLAVWLVWALLT